MTRITFRHVAQLALALGLAYGALVLFQPFFVSVLTTTVIALVVRPVYVWLRDRTSPTVSAGLTVLAVIIGILLPVSLLSFLLLREISLVAGSIQQSHLSFALINQRIADFLYSFGISTPPSVDLRSLSLKGLNALASHAGALASGVANVVGHTALILIGLFYMLQGLARGRRYLHGISPLSPKDTEAVIKRIEEVVQATVRGNSVVLLIQGALFTLAALIFGLGAPVLLGLLYGICSILPVIGSSLVWLPIAIYQAATGHLGIAIGVVIWSFAQIILMDHIVGPRLIGNRSRLNPYVALLGLLGGVDHFGLLGFIIGPTIMALGLLGLELLSRIWREEEV